MRQWVEELQYLQTQEFFMKHQMIATPIKAKTTQQRVPQSPATPIRVSSSEAPLIPHPAKTPKPVALPKNINVAPAPQPIPSDQPADTVPNKLMLPPMPILMPVPQPSSNNIFPSLVSEVPCNFSVF